MLKIYLTRHGETEWNVQERMQGQKDAPLTDKGVEQALKLGKALDNIKFNAVYSSSLYRAFRTAQIISNHTNIIVSEELKEISFGEWEGRVFTDLVESYPQVMDNFRNDPENYFPPTGESYFDVQKRVVPFVDNVISKHKEGNILIVSHGVTAKIIILHLLKKSLKEMWVKPRLKPTALSIFNINAGIVEVEKLADTSHYDL